MIDNDEDDWYGEMRFLTGKGATNLTQKMVIDEDGNVGIGTPNATHELNVNGSVNITNDLYVGGNFTGNQIYGGMWYHNHTATQLSFAVDGYYYTLFMTNATHLNGFSYTGGLNVNSSLTAEVEGLYHVTYIASGDGQNNHEYYTSIFIGDINQELCENHKKMVAGGDIITQSGNCFIDLSVGDNVTVRTADIGGTGTGNYYSANLNLIRIGD